MNKFSKGAICLSVALACAWGAKAQNVELTPDFCNAVKQYDVVQTFHDGMAAVLKDGKWGYIIKLRNRHSHHHFRCNITSLCVSQGNKNLPSHFACHSNHDNN